MKPPLRTLFFLLPLLILPASSVRAQPDGGLYEMRAVWLTTVFGLDWPCAGGPCITGAAAQEAELRRLIRNARRRGLNTVFFQAVGRADALYPSERLPWSTVLTNALGSAPAYDPLGVAIEEAHAQGLELHVWFNVFRIASMSTSGAGPRHVTEKHPEWVQEVQNPGNPEAPPSYWLNPGIPGVRSWLIENVMEIVANYDLDGIHFDFIRYASGGYGASDVDLFDADPRGFTDIDDWRRDNVNQFARDGFAAVRAAKPWVKVGSTPIGNYDGTCSATALKGFSEVFQDSRQWMDEGVHDYIVPQLYWPLGGNPAFECLAADWVGDTKPHVVLGVGAYVGAVQPDLPLYVDAARAAGASGQAFFREAFVRSADYDGRYAHRSLPPAVVTRFFEETAPSAPAMLQASRLGYHTLEWQPSTGAPLDPLRGYAVFRSWTTGPDLSPASTDLIDVVPATQTTYVDSLLAVPTGGSSEQIVYQVAAVSRLGFLSEPSNPAMLDVFTGIEGEVPALASLRLESVFPNPSGGALHVVYVLDAPALVRVRLLDAAGRVLRTTSSQRRAGSHQTRLDGAGLAVGVYFVEVSTDTDRDVRPVVIAER